MAKCTHQGNIVVTKVKLLGHRSAKEVYSIELLCKDCATPFRGEVVKQDAR